MKILTFEEWVIVYFEIPRNQYTVRFGSNEYLTISHDMGHNYKDDMECI